MRRTRIWLVLLIAILSFSCAQMTFLGGAPSEHEFIQEHKYSSYFWGRLEGDKVALRCEQGRWGAVRIRRGAAEVALIVATLGIYTPARVQLICDQSSEPEDDPQNTSDSESPL